MCIRPKDSKRLKINSRVMNTLELKKLAKTVVCWLNEMAHLVIYKLWKIKQMVVVSYHKDVNHIVDSFHVVWKEDASFYLNKSTKNPAKGSNKSSQQLVEFFL